LSGAKPGYDGVTPGPAGARPGASEAGAATIVVRVRYLSAIRDRTGLREEAVSMPAGSRLAELASWLGEKRGLRLPDPLVMATLNGRGWGQEPEGMQERLAGGDEVALFPVVGGG
jgi:molybdopterin converting factor small subunit